MSAAVSGPASKGLSPDRKNKSAAKRRRPSSLLKRLQKQEHIHRQTWFKHVRTCVRERSPEKVVKAIKQVLLELSMCRARLRERKRVQKLGELQKLFGHKILLLSRSRVFQRSAELVKISEKGRRRYTFFLFSDLLIYAAGGKVHQTLHLSLARVRDRKDTLHHDIISPQKTFTLEYPTKKLKAEWIALLVHNIAAQRAAQHRYAVELQKRRDAALKEQLGAVGGVRKIAGADGGTAGADSASDVADTKKDSGKGGRSDSLGAPPQQTHFGTSSASYETDPSLTSSFFNLEPDQLENNKSGVWVCKLCIRVYSRWMGKGTCGVCADRVCKRCSSNSLKIKGEKVRVCDCCYGIVHGMLSQSPLSNADTKA